MSDDYCLHCRAMVSECQCPDEEAPRFVWLVAVNAAKAEAVLTALKQLRQAMSADEGCCTHYVDEAIAAAERGKP